MSDILSYSHYCELIWFDIDKINYYIKIAEEQNLSVRELRERIKNKEYERLDEETKNKLKNKEELKVSDLVKNPIQIRNTSDLTTYYNVGKLLAEAGKHYGEGIIKEYSEKLTADLNKKYSYRSLNYMMKFY